MARVRILFFLALLAAACSPGLGPFELAAADGRAVDRETGEPIRAAWVVQWYLGAGVPGSARPEMAARFARTDDAGRFRFGTERVANPRLWVERADGPTYSLYHPTYGLVHAGAQRSGEALQLSASLRDSALRIADLQPFCSGARTGAGAERLAGLACAPDPAAAQPAPDASGALDAQGYRTGAWTFRWEDGSVAARGRYENGAALGTWQHFDRAGRASE